MTQRDELAGSFGAHRTRHFSNGKDVTLGNCLRCYQVVCLTRHTYGTFSFSLPVGFRLASDVHHASASAVIQMS
jgi:hypothetical protein